MKPPFMDIIILTYNSEKVLPLCLESIKKQDYPEEKIEIVIANSSSTDDMMVLI